MRPLALPVYLRDRVAPGLPLLKLAGVLLATAVLWGVATMLARAAHEERIRRGERAAASGEAALEAGRLPQAVADLREAVVLEPDRPAFRLTLARALMAQGLNKEALPYVHDVLRQSPVDGQANLALARIQAATGSPEDAETAYYRAIFGRWAPEQLSSRQQARLELVALYERTGNHARLRSALLELSAAFPGDRGLQMQAARQLLATGSADDAARVLQGVVNRFADPGDALTLLAEAELKRGDHVAAYQVALRAVEHDPRDRSARVVRDLAARVLSLDPSLPRLSSAERNRRTRKLLAEAKVRLDGCSAVQANASDLSVKSSVDRWLRQSRADLDVGYALLEAAARRLRERCPSPPTDDATDLVLRGLAAEGHGEE